MQFCVVFSDKHFSHSVEGYDVTDNKTYTLISHNLTSRNLGDLLKINSENQIAAYLRELDRNDFFLFIHDKARGWFYLANDHFGSNEIFYTNTGTSVLITNSLPCMQEKLSSLEVDAARVGEQIAFTTINPPGTIFKNVQSIPSAHIFIWKEKIQKPKQIEYWNPSIELTQKTLDYGTLLEEIRQGFTASARQEKTQIEHFGVSLSGGIDSGGLFSLLVHETKTKIPSFTIGPYGSESGDLPSARKTALFNNSPQKEIYPTIGDLSKLPKYLGMLNQPIAGDLLLTNGLVFEAAHEAGLKRLLFGFGTDNMLGCQKYSQLAFWLQKIHYMPGEMQHIIFKVFSQLRGYSEFQKQILYASNWSERFLFIKSTHFWKTGSYLTSDTNPYETIEASELPKIFNTSELDMVDRLIYADWNALHIHNRHNIVNRLGRGLGITAYNPAYTPLGGIPLLHVTTEVRKKNHWDKQVLRDALKPYAPEHLYTNRRKSCVLPFSSWLTKDTPFKSYLMNSQILGQVFDVERFFKEYEEHPEPSLSVIRLLAIALWYDMHFTKYRAEQYLESYEKVLANLSSSV